MWTIDGSMGEGGGQVLRTALALSLATRTPFSMHNVRAGRSKPGLLRQHLACIRAARDVGEADVEGDALGSKHVVFRPRTLRAVEASFAVGSAGSATLVLQTVLPALALADGVSSVRVEGGTHNRAAPPFEFLAFTYAPVLARLGIDLDVTLDRHGFFPAGGGVVRATVRRAGEPRALDLCTRGEPLWTEAVAVLSQLGASIGKRELGTLREALGWKRARSRVQTVENPVGPGNALLATLAYDEITTVLTSFGERGVRAEAVAAELACSVQAYLASDAPVDEQLADQLPVLMALGKGGVFRSTEPSLHLRTQIELLHTLLGTTARVEPEGNGTWRVEVEA